MILAPNFLGLTRFLNGLRLLLIRWNVFNFKDPSHFTRLTAKWKVSTNVQIVLDLPEVDFSGDLIVQPTWLITKHHLPSATPRAISASPLVSYTSAGHILGGPCGHQVIPTLYFHCVDRVDRFDLV